MVKLMVSGLLTASIGAMLFGGLAARADDYRPEEYLRLDLNQAMPSPKPLGPPAQFEPVPVEAKADPAPPPAAARTAAPASRVARAPVVRPQGNARQKLARSHRNPLDAQASDTRIQVWPCRSGALCNWKR